MSGFCIGPQETMHICKCSLVEERSKKEATMHQERYLLRSASSNNVPPVFVGYADGHIFEVECSLNGKQTKATVDSGAQLTIATELMLEKLGLNPKLKRSNINMILASGDGGKFKGMFEGRIRLRGRSFDQNVFVLKSDYDLLLLGTDFSYSARLIIDFYEKSVCFKDEYGNNNLVEEVRNEAEMDFSDPPTPYQSASEADGECEKPDENGSDCRSNLTRVLKRTKRKRVRRRRRARRPKKVNRT